MEFEGIGPNANGVSDLVSSTVQGSLCSPYKVPGKGKREDAVSPPPADPYPPCSFCALSSLTPKKVLK